MPLLRSISDDKKKTFSICFYFPYFLCSCAAYYIIFAGLEILDGRRSHIDGKEAKHSTVLSGFSRKSVNRNKTNFSIKVEPG